MTTTWDSGNKSAGMTLSNANLTATITSGPGGAEALGTTAKSSGKWYFEGLMGTSLTNAGSFGVADSTYAVAATGGASAVNTHTAVLIRTGNVGIDGGQTTDGLANPYDGLTVGVAVDVSAKKIWFTTNGTTWNAGGSADPATGVGGHSFGSWSPASIKIYIECANSSTDKGTLNVGATTFAHTTPSGFNAWDQPLSIWDSTETGDSFHGVGYPGGSGVLGFFTPTEARDVFSATGYTAASGVLLTFETPDQFSAYITQPVRGTWASVGAPDVMHATGIGLGEDGVFIVTEAVDIMAAVGNTPISGSFDVTELADRFRAFGAGVGRVRRRRTFFVT